MKLRKLKTPIKKTKIIKDISVAVIKKLVGEKKKNFYRIEPFIKNDISYIYKDDIRKVHGKKWEEVFKEKTYYITEYEIENKMAILYDTYITTSNEIDF